MKQILHFLKTGATEVVDVPVPNVPNGSLLIQSTQTLVSAGTERMLVEFGKANWLEKALQQPEKVRMVLDKIRTDGLQPTIDAVFNKLDQPLPLGYCNVGRIVALGAGVHGFEVGQRVVSNGKHAEVVVVPTNLCASVPDVVSDEAAAFTVLAAIALQGIRLAQPTLGEAVVVTGLGLIGLITVQLLRAQGCRVLAIDFDPYKLTLARKFGAEVVDLSAGHDPVSVAAAFSRDRGVDAVLITASTKSNEPVHQAALMCRKRGRIVLVGVAGLELSRADFYEKELTFQVSCSYGPGRYDPSYEEHGIDYPIGFVRWTEKRNFEAILDMMADGRLDLVPLISHRLSIDDVNQAYALVAGSEPSLGILLRYSGIEFGVAARTVSLRPTPGLQLKRCQSTGSSPRVSFIGAGNYARAVLIPAFRSAGAHLHSVASIAGVSGVHAGCKFGFVEATTDTARLFADSAVDALVITTRHNSHAQFVLQAIAASKHVFCEKPLCLSQQELDQIHQAIGEHHPEHRPLLMVGFNRRFAPLLVDLQQQLYRLQGPRAFVYTCNAGAIPADHWTQDPAAGGGRLLGEACHFVDLLRHLAASPIEDLQFLAAADRKPCPDTFSLHLRFVDGSIGTVHYFANGSKAFPKERLEVFAAGKVLQLDNFRRLKAWGIPGFRTRRKLSQDKGQVACCAAFLNAIETGGPAPIPVAELFEVHRWLLQAVAK